MPRDHARLRHGIWSDPDFLGLTEAAQRAYMLALSQPGVSYCGVVPFTLKRWARLATDSTALKLRRTFTLLEESRFVVVDEQSEELLFRTFVKHDGILESPNVCKASVNAYSAVVSPLLRGVFLVELHRLSADDRVTKENGWKELSALLTETIGEGLPEGFHETFCKDLPESRARALSCPCPIQVLSPESGEGLANFRNARRNLGASA